MEKSTLIDHIKQKKSTWQIARETGKSQSSIRHWLKKYKLTTHYIKEKKCITCGEEDPKKFEKRRKEKCKKCFNQERVKGFNETKNKIIQYMGGKCRICDYNKYSGALELHHVNPKEKDINVRHIRGWKWDRILEELKRCELLCSNCHAEVHGGVASIP